MSESVYPIVRVCATDTQQYEQMGSKPKFWYYDSNRKRQLFKCARANTGEDWAEKVACEVAEILGLPHAGIELAECQGKRGTVSESFINIEKGEQLVHGNELLFELDTSYPAQGEYYRGSQHKVDNIVGALSQPSVQLPTGWAPLNANQAPPDLFLGYLMLDALIGNTDRHHQNWGLVRRFGKTQREEVAPTFDHASSLGRELQEEKTVRFLNGSSKNTRPSVETYADKARSAIYRDSDEPKPLSTLEAFLCFSEHAPNGRTAWLDRLSQIKDDSLRTIVGCIPAVIIGEHAGEFAYRILKHNKRRLLST